MESFDTARSFKGNDENTAPEPQSESSIDKKLKNIYSSDSDDSDFDMEYTCDTCKKSFSGLEPLRQHQKSGKHIKAIHREKLQKEMDHDLKKLQDNSDDESSEFGYKPYTECKICRKEFSGIENYRQHLKSKAHKKKTFAQKILSEIGQDEQLDEEKLKKLFRQKERKSNAVDETVLQTPDLDSDSSTASENSDIFECKECEKAFSGVEPYYIHMTSKLHKKKLKQKMLVKELTTESTSEDGSETRKSISLSDGVLICKFCHVAFSGPESVLIHLKSRGHQEMIEFRKWRREQKLKNKQEEEARSMKNKLEADDTEEFLKEKETSKASEISTEKSEASDSKPLKDVTTSLHQVQTLLPAGILKMELNKPEESVENETENTLLAYESYKNYKKIINASKAEEQET